MPTTRRQFLSGTAAGFAALAWPGASRGQGVDPVLVALFLRGAADGLNLVVPHGDPDYYALRPSVRVSPGAELDLDGFYGLHPALAPLLPLYVSGELAWVHAAGSPHDSRSHFDAQDFMERAAPGDPTVATGWLNRYLEAAGVSPGHAGISIGTGTSPALQGATPTLSFKSLAGFQLTGARRAKRRDALEAMYAWTATSLLGRAASGAFATVDLLGQVVPQPAVAYPVTGFGAAMQEVAALIKADIGVRVVCVSLGGWDHHSNELTRLDGVANDLAATLAAFHADLGADTARTLTLGMTEFGRTAAENGSSGTDHGHGSVMLALGGGVSGGRVVTAGDQWPGLGPADLFEGRDLAVTTDFRDVFAEVLDRHMGLVDLDPVFPGFLPSPASYPGILI